MIYCYCFVPRPDIPSQRHLADRMLAALAHDDVSISTNVHPEQAMPPSLAATVAATHRPPLDHMDLLVLDGGREDPELGFLVAHAIATKKPVLYLYPKGTRPTLFDHVSMSLLPSTVVTTSYDPERIEQVIQHFLRQVMGTLGREVPKIKFTLRITDSIERYLQQQAERSGKTKADFLRAQIESLMKRDPEWEEKNPRRKK